MKTVLLLSLLVAGSLGWDYNFPTCYSPTGYRCSNSEPQGGAWPSETYCPNKGLWMSIPCDSYATMYNDNAGDIGCYNGYIYVENKAKLLQGGQCIPHKREIDEAVIAERTTYAECPVQGDPYHKVCCPSPKTCHTSNDWTKVCY